MLWFEKLERKIEKMQNRKLKIRVAKYKRVSTDEQKLKKNSIIAQDELLDEYIEQHPEMILVGDFSDEGVSGSKIKRTELDELLKMVEAKEVDLILVTKLDRWFRNIAFYYKIQEVLDRNNVAWKTILEDYDTLTADGRLKVNIMLSVAQNEVERTSERIKVVFDSKVRNKQAITGTQPWGFTTAEGNGARIVVHDPECEIMVYDFIERVKNTHSIRGSVQYINNKYDIYIGYNRARNLLKNTMLYGSYRGVEDYCPGYVTKEEWDELQRITTRNIKVRETKRVYMFSGLIICPTCGRRLGGTYTTNKKPSGKKYVYYQYRCQGNRKERRCSFTRSIQENTLERKVLTQVLPQLQNLTLEAEIEKKGNNTPKVNKSFIKEKMRRLNVMYEKGRIDDDEYNRKYEELQKKLEIKTEPKKDYTELKKLLSTDFESLYKTFTATDKQMFWRSIIDTIEIHGDEIVINFL